MQKRLDKAISEYYIIDMNNNKVTKSKKDSATEIIIGMKRYYGLKKDKFDIDREINRLASMYHITYKDVADYKEKIKNKEIIPYWE